MLEKLSELIRNRYRAILIISVILTAVSLYLTSRLKLATQMMDILPENEPEVVAYDSAIKNFQGIDSITVVVQGKEHNIINFIRDISKKISRIPEVMRIVQGPETEFLLKNGLLLMKKSEIESFKNILRASSIKDFISGLNDNFEKEYISGEDDKKISRDKIQMLSTFNTIEDFLSILKSGEASSKAAINISKEFLTGKPFMIAPDRDMGVFFVKTTISISDIDRLVPLLNEIEKLVKTEQGTYDVSAGLSGFLVLQRDEMVTSERDMGVSSILATVLIVVIFLLGFRLLRYTVLAVIPLIMGIIFAMGMTSLLIGSLNLFTAMMGAILIGLGIDYAIHIIALFTEEREKGIPAGESVNIVFKKAARGIITGSITTATGFMMFSVSSFPGFREFGIVLGTGIICTLLASIFILPSLLMIFGRKSVRLKNRDKSPLFNFEIAVMKWPVYSILAVILFILLSIIKLDDLKFSKDIKDIEAEGLESLELNDRMIEKFDFSSDITLGVSKTLEEAHVLKEKAEDLDSVSFVDSIAVYLPSPKKQKERIELLKTIKEEVSPVPDSKIHIEELKTELKRLENNLIELSDLSFMSGERKIVKKIDNIIKSKIIPELSDSLKDRKESIELIQHAFITELKKNFFSSNTDKEIKTADLPINIREDYTGKDGTFLTIIYPEGDVWNEEFQDIFVAELKSLDIPLTGSFYLSDKVMNIAGEEGKKVLILVVIAIFMVLLIDFRSFKYASLAMLPMVSMLIILTGIMSWLNIKFDYVNIMALPIIIGIGVDDGVHLIHRYLIEKNMLPAVKSTGRGIFLTSVTTSAAFGAMMISKYQGFFSLGLVLVLGIMLAYLLTVIFIPSIIIILNNKKPVKGV